jgi:ankyrin repeat protein
MAATPTAGAATDARPPVIPADPTPRERAAASAGRYTPDRCGACGAVPDPPLRCAGCRALVYCSPACQKADWREHRGRCAVARESVHFSHMEDPAPHVVGAPRAYEASAAALLGVAPDALAASARALKPAELVSLLSTAIDNVDVDVVSRVLPLAAAVGVSPTSPSAVAPHTLLGLAAANCCPRWPQEQLARALAVLRLLVAATPAAALDRPRSLSIAPPRKPAPTLLEYACVLFNRALRDDAVAMLLRAGASVAVASGAGASPPEPLHYAATYSAASTVRLLLDAGAPPNARSTRLGDRHATPLHALAFRECPEAPEKARLLVAAGADVEAVDVEGLTPLVVAAAKAGSPRVFDALLQVGANVHAVMAETVVLAATAAFPELRGCALHAAAYANDTATLRRLLAPQHRAAIDIEARVRQPPSFSELDGCTPLHFAAFRGSFGSAPKGWKGALELLLDAGADVHATDASNRPALIQAVLGSQPAAVLLLLRAGAVRSDSELAAARAEAQRALGSVQGVAAAGIDLAPLSGQITQQLVDAASRTLELLLAARAPGSGRG